MIMGEIFIDDVNSKYFRLNYDNRKWHEEDKKFINEYEKKYKEMMENAVKKCNSKNIYFANLPIQERGKIIIELNEKFKKEIQNILDGKTATGVLLKDWEIKEQNKNLSFICENVIPVVEINKDEELEEGF